MYVHVGYTYIMYVFYKIHCRSSAVIVPYVIFLLLLQNSKVYVSMCITL